MQFSGAQPSVPQRFFPQHLRNVPRVHPTLLEPTFPGPLWVSQHSQGAAAPGWKWDAKGLPKNAPPEGVDVWKCFIWKSDPWQFFGDSYFGMANLTLSRVVGDLQLVTLNHLALEFLEIPFFGMVSETVTRTQGLIKWPPMIGDQKVTAWITWPWNFLEIPFLESIKSTFICGKAFKRLLRPLSVVAVYPAFLSQNTQVVYSSQPNLIFKGQLGVPLIVYPWYLCVL